MNYVQQFIGWFDTLTTGQQALFLSAAGVLGWLVTATWPLLSARIRPRSLREDWTREADAFNKLAHEDHYQKPPGEPMPSGIWKVRAQQTGTDPTWTVRDGLTDHIRKNVEVQCRSAGRLLRHSRRSRPRVMSGDDLQVWIQFVADNGEIDKTYEGTSTVNGVTRDTQTRFIDVLTVASERTCRKCAAAEPPTKV